jgi:citrate lyase gamma subunit
MIEEFAPILYSKWEPGIHESVIIGQWTEDDSEYEITVPPQLRGLIIDLQNSLQQKYTETIEAEETLMRLKVQFADVYKNFQHADT